MQSRRTHRLGLVVLMALITITVCFAHDGDRVSIRWGYLLEGGDGLEWHDTGAAFRNGQLSIANEYLRKMAFSKDGLAQVIIHDKGWYYVKRNGKSLSVITYDNGADYFAEGLTRSQIEGKIAYFDTTLSQVIPPKYDWGWPFENGKALVCNGCRETPRDNEGHSLMVGGQWGFIDRTGREIVPVTLSREEALNRFKGD